MDPTPERTVAANARRLRKDRGYSQQRVAELMTEAGYPTGEMPLWALEKGRRRIKVADLYGLAAALDVTPESLLAEEGAPEGLPPDDDASTPAAGLQPNVHRTALNALELIFRRLKNAGHAPSPAAEVLRLIKDARAAAVEVTGTRLLDCGFCYEEQGEEVHPHPECPLGSRMTPASPSVEIINAASERLGQLPEQPIVFAGGRDSRLLIDGNFYAVSSDHPVVIDPFGSGIPGGRLTLTLNCDRITVDGKEISE